MDTSPLVIDEISAGEEFLNRLNAHQRVVAACWLRSGENEERYLYVSLDGLTATNSSAAYRDVLRIAGEMTDHYLDPFRVKLISADDPVAKAILDVYDRYPARIPTVMNRRVFAGRAVTEVYIYPPPKSNP
jgi:hypothetical protein